MERISPNTVDTNIAGIMSGMTMRIKVTTGLAPQLRALSSRLASRLRNAGAKSSTFTPRLVVICTQTMPQ